MKQILKDIAYISAGQGAPQGDSNYCSNGTPFVKAGNLIELINGKSIYDIQKVSDEIAHKHKLKLFPKGTVLFAKSGMSCLKGYIYVLPCDSYVVSHLACIVPNENLSEYLQFYFYYHRPNRLVKDASYPSISLDDIGNMSINVKSVEEREQIVTILKTISCIIDKRKSVIQKLDELVKARFVEMFGNPQNNPHSLPVMHLDELGEWTSGGTPSRSHPEYFDGTINWYSAGELNSLYLDGSVEKITEDAIDNSSAKIFKEGSMLVGMYDTAAFKMGILKEYSASNQACACIEPNEHVNIVWLYYELQLMKEYFLSQRRGVRQKNLNLGMIKSFEVPVANIVKQNEFETFVKQVDKLKFEVKEALEKLEILKKSLMQQYFG